MQIFNQKPINRKRDDHDSDIDKMGEEVATSKANDLMKKLIQVLKKFKW